MLAAEGARGLTHRAVDRALGLSDGSTSYYFRTRDALLRAAAESLLERDAADLEAVSVRGGATALVALWLLPDRRAHLLARFELLLTSARDPGFDFMTRARARMLDRVEAALRAAGRECARDAAIAHVAVVEGLLLHAAVSGPLRPDDTARILKRVTRAFADLTED